MARWRRSPLRFGNGIILAGPLGDPATPRPLADETFMAESQPPTADETGAKNFSKTLTVAVPVKHRNYCRCYSLAASIALVNSAARYCVENAARNRAGKTAARRRLNLQTTEQEPACRPTAAIP